MLENWPVYYDTKTGVKSFYEIDYKALSSKCGLSFLHKNSFSPPKITPVSTSFRVQYKIMLDKLIKRIRSSFTLRQPWASHEKVAKVMNNVIVYTYIECVYLRLIPNESQGLHVTPNFCFIIQRLIRFVKDMHLLCLYLQKKDHSDFEEIRKVIREVIRSMRKRCFEFINSYSQETVEASSSADTHEKETLIAHFLQLVKFVVNFTKYDDHKEYVGICSSIPSSNPSELHDIWSMTDHSIQQSTINGHSITLTPIKNGIPLLHIATRSRNSSVSTVQELTSARGGLARRKGSDESQITDLGSVGEINTLPIELYPMLKGLKPSRRKTAGNHDRPENSLHEKHEQENKGKFGLKGLRRASSFVISLTDSEKNETYEIKPMGRLEDVDEMDSSYEIDKSPKKAPRVKSSWGNFDEIKRKENNKTIQEGCKGSLDEGISENMNQMSLVKGEDEEIDKESVFHEEEKSEQVKNIESPRIKSNDMKQDKSFESEDDDDTDSDSDDSQDPGAQYKEQRFLPDLPDTSIERINFNEIKGKEVIESRNIKEFEKKDVNQQEDKQSSILIKAFPARNSFNEGIRNPKRRHSASLEYLLRRSPPKTKPHFEAISPVIIHKEQKTGKSDYCFQKKTYNERRSEFLENLLGKKGKIRVEQCFNDAYGLSISSNDKENNGINRAEKDIYMGRNPELGQTRLAFVPLTIPESYKFFEKMKSQKPKENPKNERAKILWKKAHILIQIKRFLKKLGYKSQNDHFPYKVFDNGRYLLKLCEKELDHVITSSKFTSMGGQRVRCVGPVLRRKEVKENKTQAMGYYLPEIKNQEENRDLEISIMMARLAYKKRRWGTAWSFLSKEPFSPHSPNSPSRSPSRDDSRDLNGSFFSFAKKRFKSPLSYSPSDNILSPSSARSRSDGRDHSFQGVNSPGKPSLFKSLFKLNPVDASFSSPGTDRSRANSNDNIQDSNSSSSPRNTSRFTRKPSLFRSLFRFKTDQKTQKDTETSMEGSEKGSNGLRKLRTIMLKE